MSLNAEMDISDVGLTKQGFIGGGEFDVYHKAIIYSFSLPNPAESRYDAAEQSHCTRPAKLISQA